MDAVLKTTTSQAGCEQESLLIAQRYKAREKDDNYSATLLFSSQFFAMAEEFNINLDVGLTLRTFFHSQFFGTPPYPTRSFAGQTVLVTGSNVGLGFEAARHFYRLNCAKLILAVRTVSKGQSAKEDIVRSVKHRSDGAEAIEIWALDLDSTESTLAFAQRANQELGRLDAVVENAGINNAGWVVKEEFEQTIQVNVINTFLLALSLLPKLTETKQKFPGSSPHLEIVSSEAHRFSKFKEINAPDIYATLNDGKQYDAFARCVQQRKHTSLPCSQTSQADFLLTFLHTDITSASC